MATRSRKEALRYRKDLKTDQYDDCVFCLIEREQERIIEKADNFYVIKNKYPYSHWDLQKVTDHLMIIPKKHTDTLSDLTSDEAVEYVKLIGSYESQGYSVYSRAPVSVIKSVVHQHTHLIKTIPEESKLLVYAKKPYIRIAI
jgi:diadenosine tetraphosphate (Ap4A) HIT family hydrolase